MAWKSIKIRHEQVKNNGVTYTSLAYSSYLPFGTPQEVKSEVFIYIQL